MKLLSASIALPNSLPLLLLLLIIIQLFQTPATILAQNTTFIALYDCPSDYANYTSSSQFESNLKNHLFPTLISNGSVDGFFNNSVGTDPDSIYGLVQCRFDVSMEDCQSCLSFASVSILQKCPNKKVATIRFENCLFRYSNIRFFSKKSLRYTNWLYDNNVTDLTGFNRQLVALFNNLTSIATSNPSKYATGSIQYNGLFGNIYGLADCTPDLSTTDCSSCLEFVLSKIPNCCSGKKGGWVLTPSCQIWYRDFQFFGSPRPALPSLPPPPPPSPSPSPSPPPPGNVTIGDNKGESKSSSSSPNIAVIVGTAVAAAAAILLLLVLLSVYLLKRKGIKKATVDGDIRSAESLQFEFITIRTATENFSDNNKLGEGGFGEVYKGELPLPGGQEIAVKRLSMNSGQGLQEFKNEVALLHKLQHRNLVRLLGFCLEGEEKLLIYEYVPNRSLDKHLFAPTIKRAYLDWGKRYKIIGGIARGLLYLHEDSRLRIIHRDLKAANILLDGEMEAKIADFGMAKLFGVNQTQGHTSRIGGTFGYMAPEYALHGLFSVKSDVFSFGVLVLEVVSGQKITSFHQSNPQQNLLSFAWKLWREGKALALMDPTLSDSFSESEVMKSINIGLLCVQENAENRPTMSSVVSMFNSNSVTIASPSQPAFYKDSDTYSNTAAREQESDLYKNQELELNHSTASTSSAQVWLATPESDEDSEHSFLDPNSSEV